MTSTRFPTAAPLPAIRGAEGDDHAGTEDEVGVATKTKAKPKKPSQYKVLMLNDDYTPMEFVVIVLKRFFRMDMEEAPRWWTCAACSPTKWPKPR